MRIWTANKFGKFHEKDSIEVKICQKVLGGYFLEHPVHAHCDYVRSYSIPHVYSTHTRLHDLAVGAVHWTIRRMVYK